MPVRETGENAHPKAVGGDLAIAALAQCQKNLASEEYVLSTCRTVGEVDLEGLFLFLRKLIVEEEIEDL
ncbi:MAG TPA: hypothetical protein VF017_07500 [Thermoanaerobaculia bacterium]|nr:hypothetical protein [Thermoanaerobaculia bacterium]